MARQTREQVEAEVAGNGSGSGLALTARARPRVVAMRSLATSSFGNVQADLVRLASADHGSLVRRWLVLFGRRAPNLPRALLQQILAYRIQAEAAGDLDAATVRALDRLRRTSRIRDDRGHAMTPMRRRGHAGTGTTSRKLSCRERTIEDPSPAFRHLRLRPW
jgi:hypothetical protein